MHASARIVAEPDGRGGTRLVERYGEPPLLVRRTGPDEVHLVGGAAGPLGGDDLAVRIEVRSGARLVVRTVAATLALPGPSAARSRTRVSAHVAAGASLEWRPEPIVAVAGCHHVVESIVELDPGARVVWREEVVCGRHDERCGDLRLLTSAILDSAPLLRQELAVGPSAPGWSGPAVLGGARTAGSVLVVDPDGPAEPAASARLDGAYAARLPLALPATGSTVSATPTMTGSTTSATPTMTGSTTSATPTLTGSTTSATPTLTGSTTSATPTLTGSTTSATPTLTGSTVTGTAALITATADDARRLRAALDTLAPRRLPVGRGPLLNR